MPGAAASLSKSRVKHDPGYQEKRKSTGEIGWEIRVDGGTRKETMMSTDFPAGGGNKRGLGLGVRRSFASLPD